MDAFLVPGQVIDRAESVTAFAFGLQTFEWPFMSELVFSDECKQNNTDCVADRLLTSCPTTIFLPMCNQVHHI